MKPSILLVGNFLSETGLNRSVGEELADRLKKNGYSILTTSSRRTRVLRLFDMLAATGIHRRRYQVAYVEVYSGPAFVWAEMVCWALRMLHKPYLLALHGGYLPAFAQRSPSRVRQLLKSANKVTAPSMYLLKTLRPYHDDICLVPNPIDIDHYAFHPRMQPNPKLIWLRAFHNTYNPQMAPRVIERLREDFPNIKLTMIGPDKGDHSMQETQELIRKLSLTENIEIIPGVPKRQVPDVLGWGDIFINTTNVDNTPVSVIEAMACGLCVVSTNVGGLPYLLEDEKDALLVSPDNPQGMANSIKRVLMDSELPAYLSENARKKVCQFDWSTVLTKWQNLLEEVAQYA